MCLYCLLWLTAVPFGLCVDVSKLSGSSPNIVFVLADDLGRYDVGFSGNKRVASETQGISSLAQKEGIILANHYTHWHCSPTRRALLTGRLPLHHGDQLSAADEDGVDLRWTWISQKLKEGTPRYKAYYVGKGHTGYKSINHLPTNKGFDYFAGFLTGSQSYRSTDRWFNTRPECDQEEYSTRLFGERALSLAGKHDFTKGPMFLLLCFQAVHVPYEAVPKDSPDAKGERDESQRGSMQTYYDMLNEMDRYTSKLADLIKQRREWNRTLFVFASDNGGVVNGNNYPLRGEKHTSFDGGLRSVAFVSGGLIPPYLRGTVNSIRMHIVDWYATIAELAGASPLDDPPVAPLPIDPANPKKDIYGQSSYPAADSLSLLKAIFQGRDLERVVLPLSSQVLLKGDYKIILGQPLRADSKYGWKQPNNTWEPSPKLGCLRMDPTFPSPCVFNIVKDPFERHPLTLSENGNRDILEDLWRSLNESMLTSFKARSPPALLGECHLECSRKYWRSRCSTKPKNAPICGIPACSKNADSTFPDATSWACRHNLTSCLRHGMGKTLASTQ